MSKKSVTLLAALGIAAAAAGAYAVRRIGTTMDPWAGAATAPDDREEFPTDWQPAEGTVPAPTLTTAVNGQRSGDDGRVADEPAVEPAVGR